MNDDFIRQLAIRLAGPLPGSAAQLRFEPELAYGRHLGPAPHNARPAAVLALLYWHEGAWHVPLTVRPRHMLEHAGQISLPGGLVESGETSRQAAVRELEEELGVATCDVQVLGQLSELYLFVSNFRIAPWVAVCQRRPEFRPSADEVDEVLEVPLAHLRDPAHTTRYARRFRALSFAAPAYRWQRHHVWGATSMILSELVALTEGLGESLPRAAQKTH